MNLIETLNTGYKILKQSNIETYRLDTEILLSNSLNISKEKIILNLNQTINIKDFQKFLEFIKRRKKKEPIAYIINKKEFWRNEFYVNNNVLIPRPETEHLVEETLKIISKNQKKRLLEIGTGSGCLILSVLKERKLCSATGIDKSKKAIKIAKFNANLHHIKNRVKFIKSDVDNYNSDTYDLVISNPPYIDKHKVKYLDVSAHEPHDALNGGSNGLEIIKKVILKSSKILKINGKLIVEIGFDQKYKVIDFLKKNNFFINNITKDLMKYDRCITSTKLI
tara:strand:+ start:36090 stop:36929 length:840 start_codon:yes stop_codon:yes gene_type:complete